MSVAIRGGGSEQAVTDGRAVRCNAGESSRAGCGLWWEPISLLDKVRSTWRQQRNLEDEEAVGQPGHEFISDQGATNDLRTKVTPLTMRRVRFFRRGRCLPPAKLGLILVAKPLGWGRFGAVSGNKGNTINRT